MYTGANRIFYEPSKELMKKMAYYYDISTAPWAFIYDVDLVDDDVAVQQCTEAVQGLRYPLIVKHYNGYSSIGMGKDCRCEDLDQVVKQVQKGSSCGTPSRCLKCVLQTFLSCKLPPPHALTHFLL